MLARSTSMTRQTGHFRMIADEASRTLEKAVSEPQRIRGARRTLGYVESLSDARTGAGGLFQHPVNSAR